MTRRTLFRAAIVGAALGPFASGLSTRASDMPEWSADDAQSLISDNIQYDDQMQLAQAASPMSSSRSPSMRTASRAARTSRVPYMIGDSPYSSLSSFGPSIGFEGADIANAEHPIFGGGRFNASENECAFPTDRIYASYRHFQGVNDVTVLGQPSSLPVERFDCGFEKTALDGMVSAELRVPVLRQLNSDLVIFSDGAVDNLPVSDRSGELGNIAVNFKLLLLSQPNFGVTAGLGVNCPTGEDGRIRMALNDPNFVISPAPLVTSIAPTNINLVGQFDNDTVNLVPYMAWFARRGGFFHQGFLQVDTPLNRSDATIGVSGQITPDSLYSPEAFNVLQAGEIDQQTLMRINAGFGYWFYTGERGGILQGLAGLFEAHYTTALDNANPFVVPVTDLVAIGPDPDLPLDVVAGPALRNVDIVNLTAGLVADLGGLQITNGFIVPVNEGQNRQFDFEYSLLLNQRF